MPINFLKEIIQQERLSSNGRYWMRKSPSEAYTDYIEGFYLFYDIDNKTDHWIFNDGFPSIILFPDKNNQVCITIDGKENIVESGWIDAGVMKKVYVRYLEDLDYILIIRFKPEYFHQLFNLKSSFFKCKNITSLAEINFDIEFLSQIFATDSIDNKINIIESYIKSLITLNDKVGLLKSAVELINQTKGQISVAGVIREIGVNYKWLERNFSKHLGLTPKEYIQLQRFISAYLNLHADPNDLLNVAITNGYYDYNHFLKEFKDFTGKTPVEYISRKEVSS
ncbi:MAG: helix-turn-helix domain-containing protein [Dysgonomonas sp.]